MTRRLYRSLAATLLAGAVVGSVASFALGVSPLHGRYFDGTQTNSHAGTTSIALDFEVSRGGSRLRHLYLNDVSFNCPGGANATLLLPGNRTLAITSGDTFTVTLPSRDGLSPNPANGSLVFSGHFGTASTAGGTIVFTGSGELAGCDKTLGWNAKVRPLVSRFSGQVTQGSHRAVFSFYRTIAPHGSVKDFTIGTLRATCPGGGAAHRSLESVDSLAVHPNAKFGAVVFFTDGEDGHISGRFHGATDATGTVSYTGRDDCSYGALPWSVHRVAARELGPLNFG